MDPSGVVPCQFVGELCVGWCKSTRVFSPATVKEKHVRGCVIHQLSSPVSVQESHVGGGVDPHSVLPCECALQLCTGKYRSRCSPLSVSWRIHKDWQRFVRHSPLSVCRRDVQFGSAHNV